ncbi:uncharacterized protein LOC143153404 [Ptiloglossa arizonensis]|uniref:uncharacterized protein LOC143153404 n=1 Tax=Ptiloglossa arizonensis TaxID=3350558 RepID=UPI003F9F06F3
MVYINPANVINLLVTALHISSKPPSPVNHREIELSEIIHTMILDSMNEVSFTTDYVTTLEYEDLARPQECEFVEEGNIEENVSSNEFDERCVSGESGNVDLNYKSRAVEFWRSGEKTRRTLDSVQHKFRKVKSVKQLYQWEETLARGGTRREKILSIVKYVLDKFQAAMNQGSFVHDMDIKQWALEAKEDVDLPTFKAGHTWIMNFKKAHNIVSRKVTKFISRSTQRDKQQLQLTSTDFVNRVKPYIAMYNPNNVYNADESGFNLEIHSGRTLSYRGRKTIEASVQSVSSTTHSYTILPTISASGHLLSPLFMVLKETSGEFGPRVEESLFRPANVCNRKSPGTGSPLSPGTGSPLVPEVLNFRLIPEVPWYQSPQLPVWSRTSALVLNFRFGPPLPVWSSTSSLALTSGLASTSIPGRCGPEVYNVDCKANFVTCKVEKWPRNSPFTIPFVSKLFCIPIQYKEIEVNKISILVIVRGLYFYKPLNSSPCQRVRNGKEMYKMIYKKSLNGNKLRTSLEINICNLNIILYFVKFVNFLSILVKLLTRKNYMIALTTIRNMVKICVCSLIKVHIFFMFVDRNRQINFPTSHERNDESNVDLISCIIATMNARHDYFVVAIYCSNITTTTEA